MKRFLLIVIALSAVLVCACAAAETAKELKPAKIMASANNGAVSHLRDNVYKTVWYAKKAIFRWIWPQERKRTDCISAISNTLHTT